jgi:hypothetical protein
MFLPKQKISLFAETGLNSVYLVQGPDLTFTEDEDDQLTKFLLGGHIGVGAGTKSCKRI